MNKLNNQLSKETKALWIDIRFFYINKDIKYMIIGHVYDYKGIYLTNF